MQHSTCFNSSNTQLDAVLRTGLHMRKVQSLTIENLVMSEVVGGRIDLEVAIINLCWKFIHHYNA